MKGKGFFPAFFLGMAAVLIMLVAIIFLFDKLSLSLLTFQRQTLLLIAGFACSAIGGYVAGRKERGHTPFAASTIGLLFVILGVVESRSESHLPSAWNLYIGFALALGALVGWGILRLSGTGKKCWQPALLALIPAVAIFLIGDRAVSGMIKQTAALNLHLGLSMSQLNEMFAQKARKQESHVVGLSKHEYWLGTVTLATVARTGELFDLSVKDPFQGAILGVRLGDNVRKAGLGLIEKGFTYDGLEKGKKERIARYSGYPLSISLFVNSRDEIKKIILQNLRYTISTRPI